MLHSEQGLGDSIQFCRYAGLVKALGARVHLKVPAPLIPSMESLKGVDLLVEAGGYLPHFDYHCPLLSLPLAFKTELHNVPQTQAYLFSRSDKREQWAQKLGEKSLPRVGLVWRGGTIHKNDHNRSISLKQLLPYLPTGYEYVSLQKEIRDEDEIPLAASDIKHFGNELVDFIDTAALCDLMDLVISVDTSVGHLAGAMARPTVLLLPYAPDWRWMLDTDVSPWYPTFKIIRQPKWGDWNTALKQLTGALNKFCIQNNDVSPYIIDLNNVY